VLDLPRCLREHGFAFAAEFGVAFARAFLRQMAPDLARCKKERIAGDVEQYALPVKGEGVWPTSLRLQWHALVVSLAAHAGVDPNLLQLSYHVQDEKLLIAGRLKGEQAPRTWPTRTQAHREADRAARSLPSAAALTSPPFDASLCAACVCMVCLDVDRDDTADKLRQVFTVILYLTDDVDSTAFPVFKVDEFAVPEFAAEDEHTVTNAAAMQATVQRGCLEKERYVRWPVRVGDMALFMQFTMVRDQGSQHRSARIRRVETHCCPRVHARVCLLLLSTSARRTP
jgi:hypothetical protein